MAIPFLSSPPPLVPGRRLLFKNSTPPRAVLVSIVALSLFLSGFCGIIAELSLFNLAEGLLGGTNANLTSTMGLMMFAMGLGAAFSAHRWFRQVSVELFVAVECSLSLLTACSVAGVYFMGGWWPGSASWWIWGLSSLIGLLVGLEIPIVLRINEVLGMPLRLNAALVMTPDYFGALAAFVLFTFVLLPVLGLARVAWLGGMLNLAVAGMVALCFRMHLRRPLRIGAGFALLAGGMMVLGGQLGTVMGFAEQLHYRDGIVLARESPYQRMVITDRRHPGNPAYRSRTEPGAAGKPRLAPHVMQQAVHPAYCAEDIRLYIDGGLQFSTCDAHRYHEMLVHPALALAPAPRRVLVLGGGDGLAAHEVLKHPGLAVTLVELDKEMVRLFRDDPRFASLNGGVLRNARLQLVVDDAQTFLRHSRERYEVIVMDFPDPHHHSTARLYSLQFFRLVAQALVPGGVLATQSMSPLYHPRAFATVRKTMRAAGFKVLSLQVPMLTFEHWGFQLGSLRASAAEMRQRLEQFTPTVATRYLNGEAMQAAQRWSKEGPLEGLDVPVNDQFTLPLSAIYRESFRHVR